MLAYGKHLCFLIRFRLLHPRGLALLVLDDWVSLFPMGSSAHVQMTTIVIRLNLFKQLYSSL